MLPWLPDFRARWSPRRAEPLLIEALLATPFSVDPHHPIMIEGALACAALQVSLGCTPDEAGFDPQALIDLPVPIEDMRRCGVLVARSSAGHAADSRGAVRYVRKRARAEHYGLATVNDSTGEHKSYNLPVSCRLAAVLRWHVVGDGEQIEHLLSLVHSLGRGRQHGLGTVAGWRVTPCPEAATLCWRDDQGPTRPLPVESAAAARDEFGEEVAVARVGWRAPYWHPHTQTLCAVPSHRYYARAA